MITTTEEGEIEEGEIEEGEIEEGEIEEENLKENVNENRPEIIIKGENRFKSQH